MKIFVVEQCGENTTPQYYMVADSAMTPWRKPYYVPGFADDFKLRFGFAVRIQKVGKTISTKFAPRYYNQAAWGFIIHAEDLRNNLANKGMPQCAAVSFDNCYYTEPWQPMENVFSAASNEMIQRCDDIIIKTKTDSIIEMINNAVCELSKTYTLKIGDIFFFPTTPSPGISIKEGNIISLTEANGDLIHSFTVK